MERDGRRKVCLVAWARASRYVLAAGGSPVQGGGGPSSLSDRTSHRQDGPPGTPIKGTSDGVTPGGSGSEERFEGRAWGSGGGAE